MINTRKRALIFLGGVVVFLFIVGLANQGASSTAAPQASSTPGGASATSAPTAVPATPVPTAIPVTPMPTAVPQLWGVHVCTTAHYSAKELLCLRDDARVPVRWDGKNSAHLSISPPGGANFTSTTLGVIISQKNADGTLNELGRTSEAAGLADDVLSDNLDTVMSTLTYGVHDVTYQIEVDEGSTLIGTATFTAYNTTPS